MHHKGTGCECVNWIHVIQDNDGHNNLLSCCTENRGFLGNQDSVFKDVLCCTWLFGLSYILESNPQLVFADFLNEKKKVSSRFQSAPFLQPPPAYKADWLNNTGCYQCSNLIRLTRRVWSGHLTACGTNGPQLMIVTGWRIAIQLWVMTASLMNNKL
jgi:hypothetical protein